MNNTTRLALRSQVRRVGPVALAAIAIITCAALCAFALQFSTHPFLDDRAPTEVLISPLDTLVIVVVIGGLWALLGRLSWALAMVSAGALVLAGINYTKIVLRHEPVYPSDSAFLTESAALVAMVDPGIVWSVFAGALGAFVAILLLGRVLRRWFPVPRLRRTDGGLNRRLLTARVLTLALSVGLLAHAGQFHQPRNLWRALYDVNAEWQPWSQVHNYRSNGFIGGFLSNMPMGVMEEPVGYDAATMAQVSEKYARRAAEINATRNGSLQDTNVVFVLSESFTDPSWLEGVTLTENPVPVAEQVMAQTIAGTMYALSYGGGTSTMEFESLTGQSVGLFNPQVTSPYPMFVADHPAYPSTVGAFAASGHHTSAIHSYHLDMYKRREVYRTLGFDTVIEAATMQSQERIENGRYISDEVAFNEVLHQLDATPGPDFVNLLTMQNHGPHSGSYSDPIAADAVVAKRRGDFGQYARGLAHTDAALGGFLTHLQARAEPTVVVFYGDHHPGIYTDDVVARNEPDRIFATPFFVWNSQTNTAQVVPAVSPTMFLPLVHEAADAPVSPYIALLDEVRHTVPVVQHGRTLDPAGQPVDLTDADTIAAALLEDLRLVQYDFSVGDRLALSAMWPGALVQPPD